MTKVIIGIVLLAVGVGMIAGGLWLSYEIFTGKRVAPEFFSLPQTLKDIEETRYDQNQEATDEETLQQVVSEQINALLPSDFLPKMFNLTIWSIFVFILIYGANKIAVLGIKLINSPRESRGEEK